MNNRNRLLVILLFTSTACSILLSTRKSTLRAQAQPSNTNSRLFMKSIDQPQNNNVFKYIAISSTTSLFPILQANAAASDAIDLLTGYKPVVPDFVTWTVLLAGAYMTQYKIFKFLSTL